MERDKKGRFLKIYKTEEGRKEAYKKCMLKYQRSGKGKATYTRASKKYYNSEKGRLKHFLLASGYVEGAAWRLLVKIGFDGRIINGGYFQFSSTEKISEDMRRKQDKRRGYGRHKLSFEHLNCVWHHINKNDMVQVPVEIHEFFKHMEPTAKIEGVLG